MAAPTWGKKKGLRSGVSVEVVEESTRPMQSSVEAAAGTCPDHVEHLFHGEGWQNCRICWAWLSQVTIQFTRAGLVEDNGNREFVFQYT
jgi:hypothetical protein